MRISRKGITNCPTYHLDNVQLASVNTVIYLGVNIYSNLSWNPYVTRIVGAANRCLGFVQCIFHGCPEDVKETGYSTLVRLVLVYCAPIWSPHGMNRVQELEMV
jgi:hypothetical protein